MRQTSAARWTRTRRSSTIAAFAAAAVVIVGCSSSSSPSSSSSTSSAPSSAATSTATQPTSASSSSGPLAAAAAALTAAAGPINWTAPGGPFDTSAAKGKTIWWIDAELSIPFEQLLVKGLQQGVDLVGAKLVVFDGKSQVAEYTRGVNQAVAQHADVILLGGFPQSLVTPALAKAKAAGIPVIDTHSADALPGSPGISDAIVAAAGHSYTFPGKIMADYVAVDSNGTGKVAFIESNDLQSSNVTRDAFTAEMKTACPGCDVKIFSVNVATWNGLQVQTQSILRANPDITYIVPVFDGMALYVIPGITASGNKDKVKVVTFNATPAVMQELAKKNIVVAEVGNATLWEGWSFADQTFRVLAKQTPLEDVMIPERLFTAENIGQIDLNAQESTWYGPTDYQAQYKKLWGL